ncbi:hypothetical protein [Paraburkholderia xenovorans]
MFDPYVRSGVHRVAGIALAQLPPAGRKPFFPDFPPFKEIDMANQTKHPAQHHQDAATHHEHAAAHHRQAAKHHEAGETEKANHHAHVAHGHEVSAGEHASRAATHQATEHGRGKSVEK